LSRIGIIQRLAAAAATLLSAASAQAFEPPGSAADARAAVPLERLLSVPAAPIDAARGAAFAFGGFAGARPIAAPPTSRYSWIRGWAPAVLLGAAFAVVEFAIDPPKDPRWTAGNAFDDGIRDGLRAGSRSARDGASVASDVLVGGMAAFMVGDWVWLREDYGGWESVRTELPWLLGSELATGTLKLAAGRQRPYVDPCQVDPDYIADCSTGRDANTSFPSGHTSTASTMAGMICARHLHRPNRSAMDWWACGGAVAGAFTTGILRISADQHYATDVLTSWASGALFGYLLPAHFKFRPLDEKRATLQAFTPLVGPRVFGLRYELHF
jgi:membrane-associated phospholipid phosphatase